MIYFLIPAAFAKTQTFLGVDGSFALKEGWNTQGDTLDTFPSSQPGICSTIPGDAMKTHIVQDKTNCEYNCIINDNCLAYAYKEGQAGSTPETPNCLLYKKKVVHKKRPYWNCYKRVAGLRPKRAKTTKEKNIEKEDIFEDAPKLPQPINSRGAEPQQVSKGVTNFKKYGEKGTWCANKVGKQADLMVTGTPQPYPKSENICEVTCNNSERCKGYSWKEAGEGREKCMWFEGEVSKSKTAQRAGWNGCMIKKS